MINLVNKPNSSMMAKGSLLSVTLLLFSTLTYSQISAHITVKSGDDAGRVIPRASQYFYKDFRQGQLYYPNSERSESMKLNFNLLTQTVMFISALGDSIAIKEEENIFTFIRIGGDLYYHDLRAGYFLLLSHDPKVQLAVKNSWTAIRKEHVVNNGYGNISSAGGTEVSHRRSTETTSFVQHEDAIYGKEKDYYLITNDERLFKANRAGFMRLYQDYKDQIRDYLKSSDVDFMKEDDLRKLLIFCQELTKNFAVPARS